MMQSCGMLCCSFRDMRIEQCSPAVWLLLLSPAELKTLDRELGLIQSFRNSVLLQVTPRTTFSAESHLMCFRRSQQMRCILHIQMQTAGCTRQSKWEKADFSAGKKASKNEVCSSKWNPELYYYSADSCSAAILHRHRHMHMHQDRL